MIHSALKVASLALILLLSHVFKASAQWQSAGELKLPEHSYTFLATTPGGDLLAATFNNQPSNQPPRSIPVLLIRNPTTPQPEVVEIYSAEFPPQRGYGGVVASSTGEAFVSGDTGERESSFIVKFGSDGKIDTSFGENGILKNGRRYLGMDMIGENLLVAVDWGIVQVFDAKTGQQTGELPTGPRNAFMRGVAIDPRSLRVFGVAQGGVLMWGGGAPWNATDYKYAEFSPPAGEPKASEGITLDPIRRCVIVTPFPGTDVHEIHGNGRIVKSPVTTARPDSHLSASAISFDGRTLFVSDVQKRRIHALRRDLAAAPVKSGAYAGTVASESQATVQPPTWHQSYEEVLQEARQKGKPMIVYFRTAETARCVEFETNVLLTNEFNTRAQNHVCVFEDVSRSRLMAHRFGVVRVPHIVVLDPSGESKVEFSFNIPPAELLKAMEVGQ